MRRILLSCATLAVLTLVPAASAGARTAAPGFLVVQKGLDDGGVHGHPMVTLVVEGFVLGRIAPNAEAQVDIYQSPSAGGGVGYTAVGPDYSSHPIKWHGFHGRRYTGSGGFRFRATDGAYRLVIRGSGVYLFAGGHGSVRLRGSSVYKNSDGKYSVDGAKWRSLPTRAVTRKIGGG